MRVLYFHQHFSTRSGSTGTRSYEFARELIAHGHEVTMVCGSYELANRGLEAGEKVQGSLRRGTVDGIQVIEFLIPYSNYDSLPVRAGKFLRFAWLCIQLSFSEEHDLIFATSTPLTAGLPAIVRRLLGYRTPFVFEVRDLWPELPRAMGVLKNPVVIAGLSALEWGSYHSADTLVGLSPGIVEGIRRNSPAGSPIALVPNGCDLDLFQSGGSRDELACSIPGVGSDDCLAVFTGAHGLANGLDAVLDAARELKRRRITNIKILFVGDGMTKPGLVARANRDGLDNCLFWDPVPKTKLAQVVRRADVGLMVLANVSAFYYGTSPNKFFDYLAAGLPVMVNYPGWVADLIHEGQCGLAVPPEDPQAFADALVKFAASAEWRAKLGSNARRLAERSFSRPDLSLAFVQLIDSTFERATVGGPVI